MENKSNDIKNSTPKKFDISKRHKIWINISVSVGCGLIGLGLGIEQDSIIAGIAIGTGIGLILSTLFTVYLDRAYQEQAYKP